MLNNSTIKPIYNFEVSAIKNNSNNDVTLLSAREYPWCVLQIVPIPKGQYDAVIGKLKEHGYVACPDDRKDFAVIHVGSGNYDGKHPEHHVKITQDNHQQILSSLKECMRQGAIWWGSGNPIAEY